MKILISLFALSTLALGQGVISGTLYASDVRGFIVIGCLLDLSTQDCNYEKSQYTEVATNGAYTLVNVEPGQYLVIAWRDTNNSGDLEEGQDEIGYYTDASGEAAIVTAPASNINISVGANPLTPTTTNNPLTSQTQTGSIVGSWFWGTVSSTSYYNESTGIWADPSGGGLKYTFNPDGTYEGNFLFQNTFYSCSTRIFSFTQGTYSLEDQLLTLTPTLDKTKSEDDCHPSKNYEKDLPLETQYRFIEFRRDISEYTGEDLGEVMDMTDLVINSVGNLEPDPESPEPTTYRRETP
jgi:hypothetical protein